MSWDSWHRSVGSFQAVKYPEATWLISGLVPGFGITFLVSAPGAGKSIFAYQVCEALSLGVPLLGFDVPRSARCAYVQVDAPMPEWQAQLRLVRARPDARIIIPQETAPWFLDSAIDRERVARGLQRTGAEFVVFDSLYMLTKCDWNAAESVPTFLERLRAVWPGPCLILHHSRKPSRDREGKVIPDGPVTAALGHTFLAGCASVVLGLFKGSLHRDKSRLCASQIWPLARDATARWVLSAAPSRPELAAYKLPD